MGNSKRFSAGGQSAGQTAGKPALSCLSAKEAEKRGYLSAELLNRMHLTPTGAPIAFTQQENGETVYYYDARHVAEAAPELWYRPLMEEQETRTLDSGETVLKMNARQAAARGWYTRERLDRMGYDVAEARLAEFKDFGGEVTSDPDDIYRTCDVVMQILPTHPIIIHSVERAIELGKPGNIIIDLSSTAPDIVLDLHKKALDAGMFLLDCPVSGGNPMAIAGTLAMMAGGEKEAFDRAEPLLACMGHPIYTGGSGSGSVTKLVNNLIGGAELVAMCEGYAFAAKAGIDLQTTFEATRCGFVGGPMYENKVPKIIHRDYEPGARIAVHRKDILNAKHYAHKLGVDLPMTDVVLHVMDWMNDNGHIDDDQAAMVKYYEEKMGVTVGSAPDGAETL